MNPLWIFDFGFWIGRPERRSVFCLALGALLFAHSGPVEAQQPKKVPRIGYLTPSIASNRSQFESFRQGLRELGYFEGKNIVIEWRANEGKLDRNPALAAELVRLKVDVIVAVGSGEIRAAKEATAAIPIVMVRGGDPVGSGFVASLARPGGNITGLALLRPELSGKRLELLKEIVPKLSRVTVIASSNSSDYAQVHKEIELAAGAFGVKLKFLHVLSLKDVETGFGAASKERADAVFSGCRAPSCLLTEKRLQRSQ